MNSSDTRGSAKRDKTCSFYSSPCSKYIGGAPDVVVGNIDFLSDFDVGWHVGTQVRFLRGDSFG